MNFPLGAIVNYYVNYHCAWSKVWQSSWLLYVPLLLVWFLYQNTLSVYTIKTEDGIPSYLFPLPIFMIFLSGSKFIGTVLFLLSSSVSSTGQVWINGGNVCTRIRSISTPMSYFVLVKRVSTFLKVLFRSMTDIQKNVCSKLIFRIWKV